MLSFKICPASWWVPDGTCYVFVIKWKLDNFEEHVFRSGWIVGRKRAERRLCQFLEAVKHQESVDVETTTETTVVKTLSMENTREE